MEIIYPEDVETTEEEREFDNFLLSYISAEAVKKRSPKVHVELGAMNRAWKEHQRAKKISH